MAAGPLVRAYVTFSAAFALLGCGNLDYDEVVVEPPRDLRPPRTDVAYNDFGDLVMRTTDRDGAGELWIWQGNNGGFYDTPVVPFTKSQIMAGAKIAVVDTRNDGAADVILARPNPDNPMQTFIHVLDGSEAKNDAATQVAQIRVFGQSLSKLQLAAGRINKDSNGDLVIHTVDQHGAGVLYVYQGGAPRPVWLWEQPLVPIAGKPEFSVAKIAVSDLTGDGWDDIILAVPDGRGTTLWMVEGGNPPTLREAPIGRLDRRYEDLQLAGGDVTGDGHGDIIVHIRDAGRGTLWILRGHEDGFWPRPLVVFQDDPIMRDLKLTTTDITGDSIVDIILVRRDGDGTEMYWIAGDEHPVGHGALRYRWGFALDRLELG